MSSGCGSVWLERRLREAEAASSNLVTPTWRWRILRNQNPFLLLLIPLYSFMTTYIAPKPPIFLSTFQKLIKPQSKEVAFLPAASLLFFQPVSFAIYCSSDRTWHEVLSDFHEEIYGCLPQYFHFLIIFNSILLILQCFHCRNQCIHIFFLRSPAGTESYGTVAFVHSLLIAIGKVFG